MCIAVTSTKESKVGAIREAFQQTFGKAVVMGRVSKRKPYYFCLYCKCFDTKNSVAIITCWIMHWPADLLVQDSIPIESGNLFDCIVLSHTIFHYPRPIVLLRL